MTRSMTTAAVLYAATASSLHAQAPARTNYSGTWVLDVAKSQASGALPASAQWVVSQHGDTVAVDRETSYEEIGAIKARLVVAADGKSWKNIAPQPGVGDIETTSTASWDKAVLVIVSSGNIQGTDFVQTDRWTLGADGKTLTSLRSVTVDGNEVQSATFVFSKKS